MRINVSPRERDGFWDWAAGARGWWGYRRKPDCRVGDAITFTMDRQPVATAVIRHIDKPGLLFGAALPERYRTKAWWKIHWSAESFEDLRDEQGGAQGFTPQLYGNYQESKV